MNRRKWLRFSVLAALCLVGVSVHWLIPPKPGVTRENFRRLHKEMTLARIDALLDSGGLGSGGQSRGVGERWEWNGEEGSVLIILDVSRLNGGRFVIVGQSAAAGWFTTKDGKIEVLREETVVEMLQRWLGL